MEQETVLVKWCLYKRYNEQAVIWKMYLNEEKATAGEHLVKFIGNIFSLVLDNC